MSTFHGNEGEFHVDANTVLEVTGFDYTDTSDWVEDSCAGDLVKTYKPGKRDGSGSLRVRLDPSDTTGQAALVPGSTKSVILYPVGTASGRTKLEGTIYVENRDVQMDQDDIVSRNITFKGALEESVVAP